MDRAYKDIRLQALVKGGMVMFDDELWNTGGCRLGTGEMFVIPMEDLSGYFLYGNIKF